MITLAEKIGQIVRKYREDSSPKITQEQMADKLQISRSTLSLIEKGKQEPGLTTLKKIVEVTKVSLEELLDIKFKTTAVVDTNVILNRPRVVDVLSEMFDEVVIPKAVVQELTRFKDRGNEQQRKVASLCLSKLIELKSDAFIIDQTDGDRSRSPDDRIMDVAIRMAESDKEGVVYLLTDDKDFKLKDTKGLTNLRVITSKQFAAMTTKADGYNIPQSQRFFDAVRRRDVGQARQILNDTVDVNFRDGKSGYTPLIQAVRRHDTEMVSYLLSIPQTDINAVDNAKYMFPPLSHAIQVHDIRLIELLLANSADVNAPSRNQQNMFNTPLMIAAWDGRLDIVRLLVENGACLNQVDKLNGFTPLIKAVFRSHPSVVRYLVDQGADIGISSFEGKRAIDYAYERSGTGAGREIIEILKGIASQK